MTAEFRLDDRAEDIAVPPDVLRVSLLDHPGGGEIIPRGRSAFGEHCNVVGPLRRPDGRNPTITTCWTKRQNEDVWRFTTLLPR